MHCELVVPGLFEAAARTRLPAAELLAGRGRRSSGGRATLEAWLADRFELDGPLAAGALTLLAHGEDASGLWARADPVHLQILRDRLALVPAEAFPLSATEAQALCEALNRHFAGRCEFRAIEPRRWCVRLHSAEGIEARSALELAGTEVRPRGGIDALANEIQMALHEHPVNAAREARGEPEVNGLWLWGAGAKQQGAQAPWHSVSADEPLALGLARAAGLRQRGLPASAEALLDRAPEDGRHLVVLDGLRIALACGDAQAAQQGAEALEARWFAPLLDALRGGRIGMLTLQVPDAGFAAETIRGDLRRFWRRARPLATMAP